jgi:hypothetical protein
MPQNPPARQPFDIFDFLGITSEDARQREREAARQRAERPSTPGDRGQWDFSDLSDTFGLNDRRMPNLSDFGLGGTQALPPAMEQFPNMPAFRQQDGLRMIPGVPFPMPVTPPATLTPAAPADGSQLPWLARQIRGIAGRDDSPPAPAAVPLPPVERQHALTMPFLNQLGSAVNAAPQMLDGLARAGTPYMTITQGIPSRPGEVGQVSREHRPTIQSWNAEGTPLQDMTFPYRSGRQGATGQQQATNPLDFANDAIDSASRRGYATGGHAGMERAELAAMQAMYQGMLPANLQHQAAMAGIGLQGTSLLGVNGIPGSMFNAAQEGNARFSPEGIANQTAVQMAIQGLQNGTLHQDDVGRFIQETIRQLVAGRRPATDGGSGEVAMPGGTTASRISSAISSARRSLPMGTNNQPLPYVASGQGANADQYHQAINTYLDNFSEQELTDTNSYNQIMAGLTGSPLGPSLQNWYTSWLPQLESRMTPVQRQQNRRRQIIMRVLGHEAPVSPMGFLPTWSRYTPAPYALPITWPLQYFNTRAPSDNLPVRR